MGEWTWLHVLFPNADIELTKAPIEPADANVLVRVVRKIQEGGEERFQVRVAPHNVAPFRGGPWLHTFTRAELEQPQEEFGKFRSALAEQLKKVKTQ